MGLKIRTISRGWKDGYCNVEHVKGMYLHGGEFDDGNAYYLLFTSTRTDLPAEELFDVWCRMCNDEQEVKGYKRVDPDTVEKVSMQCSECGGECKFLYTGYTSPLCKVWRCLECGAMNASLYEE